MDKKWRRRENERKGRREYVSGKRGREKVQGWEKTKEMGKG